MDGPGGTLCEMSERRPRLLPPRLFIPPTPINLPFFSHTALLGVVRDTVHASFWNVTRNLPLQPPDSTKRNNDHTEQLVQSYSSQWHDMFFRGRTKGHGSAYSATGQRNHRSQREANTIRLSRLVREPSGPTHHGQACRSHNQRCHLPAFHSFIHDRSARRALEDSPSACILITGAGRRHIRIASRIARHHCPHIVICRRNPSQQCGAETANVPEVGHHVAGARALRVRAEIVALVRLLEAVETLRVDRLERVCTCALDHVDVADRVVEDGRGVGKHS